MTTPTVVLPSIVAEAGFVANPPVQGPPVFILDDGTYGQLDAGNTLGGAHIWTDISAYVLGFTITRPSSRVIGPLIQFQAGTASITLDNSDGRFDPDNLSGPYVGGGVSQVHAMIPVRIRASFLTDATLFTGYADSWQESTTDYNAGYSEWILNATDAFKILGGQQLATISAAGGGELTGARVKRILDAAGWYTGTGDGARRVNVGDSTLQATTFGDNALALLQLAVDSEIGWMYMDGTGAFTFRRRTALLTFSDSASSQATFGDQPTGTELPCAAIGRMDDDTTIANDVQAQRAGGALQEVTDATSIAKYLFPRTYNRTDLIVQADSDALNWAQWVLYIAKGDEDRFDTVTIDPAAQPYDLWPQIFARDMGDRITVIKRPSGGAFTVTRDCFVTGISHTWDSGTSEWSTVWTLADASKYGSFLTLDDPILGKLDSNALTF